MVKKIIPLLLSSLWLLGITSCAFKSVSRTKDITYLAADSSHNIAAQELNVFAPKKQGQLTEVFIFVHGGPWNSGHKSLYNFLGNFGQYANLFTNRSKRQTAP